MAETMRAGNRLPKGLMLRGLVAVVLLASLFLLQADLARTLQYVLNAEWRWLLPGVGIALAGEVLTALKLKRLYDGAGRPVPLGPVTRSCFIAMFYNNILPGSIGGDIARVFLLARAVGGKAVAAAGVFMQRNTGMGGLLIVALAASWFPPFRLELFSGRLAWLDRAGVWFVLVTAAYVATNLVLISDFLYRLVWLKIVPRLAALAARAAGAEDTAGDGNGGRGGGGGAWLERVRGITGAVMARAQRLHEALRIFRRGWGMALVISVATQLVDCTLVWLAGRALGLAIPFQFLCICVPAVILAALLPVSVNGIGLREWVYSFFLSRIGIDTEAAVALSLLHFGVQLLLSLGGGVLQWMGAGEVPSRGTTTS